MKLSMDSIENLELNFKVSNKSYSFDVKEDEDDKSYFKKENYDPSKLNGMV